MVLFFLCGFALCRFSVYLCGSFARFLAGLYAALVLGSDCLRIRLFKSLEVSGQPRFLLIQNVKAVLVLNAELVLDFAEVGNG